MSVPFCRTPSRNRIPEITIHEPEPESVSQKLPGKQTISRFFVKRIKKKNPDGLKRKLSKADRRERRATKTLAVVLGVFLICWAPFFVTNTTNALCTKFGNTSCQIGFLPFFLSTWLGYVNSCMNPIIYTIFSGDFRKAFRYILCGCKHSQR